MAARTINHDTEGIDRFIETFSGIRAGMTEEVLK